MKLYDIHNELEKAYDEMIDKETGEILEDAYERFGKLKIDLTEKLENTACYIKNLASDAEALAKEEKTFSERKKVVQNKIKNLKKFLDGYMQFSNLPELKTSKCVISYRKSNSTNINDIDKFNEFINAKKNKALKEAIVKVEETVNLTELKKLLDQKIKIPGAEIVENKNIQVK